MARVSSRGNWKAPGRRSFSTLAVLASTAIVIAGCAPSAENTESNESTVDYPIGDWGACPLPGQESRVCGSIEVGTASETDSHPMRIAVAVTPARSPEGGQREVLVVDPGGPLQSGITAQAALAATFPEELRNRFDIVGYDRRGFGASSPVKCNIDDPPEFKAETFDADWNAFATGAIKALRECETNSDDPIFQTGTLAGVRDLDAVRDHLEVDQINMLATSYGTLLGQAYLSQFPERVRTMVLDGVMSPEVSGPEYTLSGQIDLDTATASYGTDLKPTLAPGFAEEFKKLAAPYAEPGTYAQDLAYSCTDFDWPESPATLPAGEAAMVLTTRAHCFAWPAPAPLGPLTFAEDAPKPLLFNSIDDPRTLLADAERTAANTSGSLVTMPGPHHGLVSSFSCPQNLATEYFLTGTLPAPSSCPAPSPAP